MNTNDSIIESSILNSPPAPVNKRLLAMLYDSLILIALWFFVAFVFLLGLGAEQVDQYPYLQYTLFPLLETASFIFYYWFWRNGGQTLGMRAWRLMVVDGKLNGDKLSFFKSLKRFLIAQVSFLTFGLGYFIAYFSPSGQSLHDVLSGTKTLLLSPEDNKKIKPYYNRLTRQ